MPAGPVEIEFRKGGSGSSVHSPNASMLGPYKHDHGRLKVFCHKLSDVFRKYEVKPPLFIKVYMGATQSHVNLFLIFMLPFPLQIDIEGFEADQLPTLGDLILKFKPTVHLSLHPAVREFSDHEWALIDSTLSRFPVMYSATANGWRFISMSERASQMAPFRNTNHEILLSWHTVKFD
jgi:hypothetical protein